MTAAPTYEDLFAGLLPQGRKLLLHLLTCNDCRQEIVPNLLGKQLPGLIPAPEEWSEEPPKPPAGDAAEPAAALAELFGRLPEERAALLAEERFYKLSLLELLGRFDEADSLLAQASRHFAGARLLTEEGATLILLGLFETERGLFPLATVHLLGGLAAIDGRERPWLSVRGGLAMALSMAEQGGKPHAVELLNRLRNLYPCVQDPGETIRLYWLEGQLRTRLGDAVQARELLVSVRRKYVNQLQLHEAVLASLDLAAVPDSGKQPEESPRLIDELEERFAGAQGLSEILKALRQQSSTPLQATLPKAAEPLRALLVRHGHYAQPLPFT